MHTFSLEHAWRQNCLSLPPQLHLVTKTDIQARSVAFLPLRSWNSKAAPPRNPAGDTTSHCCHPIVQSSLEAFPPFFIQHLKWAQPQLDVQSGCDAGVLRQEGKHCVVHSEQRDEKKSGFSQPPVEKVRRARLQIRTSEEQKLKGRISWFVTPSKYPIWFSFTNWIPSQKYCRKSHINS